ncbi:MAG: proline/glycine betaine ABC transporter permease [Dehalococcoidales bacterium]|nr:MAG: proline/glycine betaine ABC transporter permease [Dehalococcoidales bacterium]
MFDFPEVYFPLGEWINVLVDWLTRTLDPFFDVVTEIIRTPLVGIERFLLWLPWWIVIGIFVAIAWKFASWKIALFALIGLAFIGVMGVWDDAMTTLAIVLASVLVSLIVGIPIGIAAAKSDRVYGLVRPILDFMQTMPAFVYLIPAVFFFGLGKVPAVVATCIYAVPPCIRLTNLGIRQVPADTVEAGRAFGTTPRQLLFRIQIPLAIPTIMAGINQTIMMALAMVVICSMIGAAGLGLEVLKGIQRLDLGRAFIAGISIVIMAMVLDRITQSFGASRDTTQRRN